MLGSSGDANTAVAETNAGGADDVDGCGAIIVVRHGERLDYVIRDSGGNWVQNPENDKPWDPPLSIKGENQSYLLGCKLVDYIEKYNLPTNVVAIYSSPLIRCIQTAAYILRGFNEVNKNGTSNNNNSYHDAENSKEGNKSNKERKYEDEDGGGTDDKDKYNRVLLDIKIEHGLVESLCEDWYRSWCFPDSDSTWGYNGNKHRRKGRNHHHQKQILERDDVTEKGIHLMAKTSAKNLFLPLDSEIPNNDAIIQGKADVDDEEEKSKQQRRDQEVKVVNVTNEQMCFPIINDYQWGQFETRREQSDRIHKVAKMMSYRHPNETVILVSHGAPVTHLFERITGKHRSDHGPSKYTCCSIYKHKNGAETCNENENENWTNVLVNDASHWDDYDSDDAAGLMRN